MSLLGLEIAFPIFQAPMAGASGSAMAIAVAEAGGLGSLPCAMFDVARARTEIATVRAATKKPIHLNFFAHRMPPEDPEREEAWKKRLGVESASAATRRPFDEAMCDLVVEARPEVVSFHFGLPEARLVERVKSAGAKVLASATTVREALFLAERGCDAIIAQGFEAGGHRGMFLSDDIATQVGTMALVPQVVDAVSVPVIAAGGIADGRGIRAAFALGASAVQIGTAYLFCEESLVSAPYARALREADDDSTVLTNVFTGRPARGIVNRFVRELGPMTTLAPAFPTAGGAVAPLRAKAEASGSADYTPLWAGQGVHLARVDRIGARELTLRLARTSGIGS